MFGRKRRYQRFLYLFVLLQAPLALAVGLFNYTIDPMWCFNHANRYNCVQADIDDRQQKTNYLTFGNKRYDTLIVGNSRVKMMNQYDFGPGAYNYAVNGMSPREYDAYINYAKKANGRDFDRIVIGLSFAMSNRQVEYASGHEPSFYFDNANRFPYRWLLLFNGDVFTRSWSNLRHSMAKDLTVYYDRDTVEHVNKGRVNLDNHMPFDLADMRETYRDRYDYLSELRSVLEQVKRNNPRSRITVFTTPVSEPLYSSMVSEGRFEEYKKWLRDLVGVFGEVHHFEYLNTPTREYRQYFIDGHHYAPETGTLLVHRMKGIADPALPADFGMVLNASNLEEKLRQIEQASAALVKRSSR
jgi:hypothetical protein